MIEFEYRPARPGGVRGAVPISETRPGRCALASAIRSQAARALAVNPRESRHAVRKIGTGSARARERPRSTGNQLAAMGFVRCMAIDVRHLNR